MTVNRRSLVLEYLMDLICLCVEHPWATNEILLVKDGELASL
ncbi:MAG: hypothetical protein WCX90_08460 [Thiohalomonadaceae bacterium]